MKSERVIKSMQLVALILGLFLIFDAKPGFASNTENMSVVNPDGGSKYGKDSVACVTNLSLYREYYKQWRASKYKDDAIAESIVEPWSKCFNGCPQVSKNMYYHGIRLVSWEIKQAKKKGDTALANSLVDTLVNIYKQQIEAFPNDPKNPKGTLVGKQGLMLAKYRKNDVKEYYKLLDSSVALMGNHSEASILKGYFYATEMSVAKKYAPRDLVFDNYIKVIDIIEWNLNHIDTNVTDPKKARKAKIEYNNYKVVESYIDSRIEKYATCEKLQRYYGPKQEENPDDLNMARKIVKFFEMRKCTDSDIYYKALAKVHAESPTAESALSMGKMAMERKEYSKAKTYLEQATEMMPDSLPNKKGAAYLLLAEDLRTLNQYAAARAAALNALKYKPNEGMAYIIIGDMYVSSAKKCQESGISVAYWAAADKYQKAINVADDEKVKSIARQRLAGISKSFPIKQDLFMRNWTEGQSMKVGCWINETTTVRARK